MTVTKAGRAQSYTSKCCQGATGSDLSSLQQPTRGESLSSQATPLSPQPSHLSTELKTQTHQHAPSSSPFSNSPNLTTVMTPSNNPHTFSHQPPMPHNVHSRHQQQCGKSRRPRTRTADHTHSSHGPSHTRQYNAILTYAPLSLKNFGIPLNYKIFRSYKKSLTLFNSP